MPVYFKTPSQCPDTDFRGELDATIDAHERFKPLRDHGLTIDIILAFSDKLGPALTKNGSHPEGYIKRGDKDARAEGRGDVKIYVDAAKYSAKTPKERMAFWAHELYHVEMPLHPETTMGDEGQTLIFMAPDLDDYGRPKVKLIPDGYSVTGFREVAEWYGPDSGEVHSYKAMGELLKQALLPFMASDDRGDPSTVTFSSSGKSVTLTGEQLRKVADARGATR